MDRLILHCDLNNFYASVEVKFNPALQGVPLVVAGDQEKRHGVVLAKNDLAKSYGIKTGEPLTAARVKAPNLTVVPPHFDRYTEESQKVVAIYRDFTSQVEPFGADECWLDCTGSTRLFGDGRKIADTIRERIKKERGLTISVGVSFNKVFAKLGSDYKKPDAVTVITRENYKAIVWPLPVSELFMVGKKTAEKLSALTVRTIGDLANADAALLKRKLGINGLKLKQSASGLDDEPVREAVASREIKSVGHGMTAAKGITRFLDADTLIYYLSDLVAVRLRKYGKLAAGVALSVRGDDLHTVTKQTQLPCSLANAAAIAKAAGALLRACWKEGDCPIRTLTVSTFSLSPDSAPQQLSLFDSAAGGRTDKSARLEKAMDSIRGKYGKSAIVRADLSFSDFLYDKTDEEDFLPFQR